jgi:hypothetical protein
MRPKRAIWLLLAVGLLLGLAAMTVIAPRRARAMISRLRYPEPIAVADSFVAAAVRRDTAGLRALALDTLAPMRLLDLLHTTRGLRAIAEQGLSLAMAGGVKGRPWVVVTYRLPYRLKESFCYLPGATDHLQVTLVSAGKTWKVEYIGLDPC